MRKLCQGGVILTKRSYRQACALAVALDVVGERWTLLIIRELLLGPRRYNQLLDNLAGIGTNLLAARLRAMEDAGLITRVSLEGEIKAYQLTPVGHELEAVVNSLIRWGLRLAVEPVSGALRRSEWDIVALNALLQEAAPDVPGVFQLMVDGTGFVIEIADGRIDTRMGQAPRADATISVDTATGQAMAKGQIDLRELQESGRVQLTGNKTLALRFLKAAGVK